MRLRKVRLTGFKSFVDPTTIAFPGNLIGIVGPNGCGKSNIIDAVRWVMGELSARHLRGTSMADVVFTGSHTRQPLSQASVELVFDNSAGRLGGRYAAYPEISIKRQVGREGHSQYFLNATQCRRRDVMDVFLGTGLGPRSYTIIEQGTISRLIEAKPEELRAFLEEAAGIAKYRERRRETESRIHHARENLERLGDRREEIGRRLVHLKRQATIAERYKAFKDEERVLEAELIAQRWQRYDTEVARHQRELGVRERALDAALAGQRRAEAELEHARSAHQSMSDAFNQVYRQVLDAGTEIARVEERIRSLRQQRERAEQALERERADLGRSRAEAREEREQLESLEALLAEESRESEAAERRTSEARSTLRQNEEAMRAWQAEWEAIRERAEVASQAARSENSRLQYAGERLDALRERAASLDEERGRFAIAPLQKDLDETRERLGVEQSSRDALATRLAEALDAVRSCRARQDSLARRLHEKRTALEAVRGRESALERLQHEALGQAQAGVETWLGQRGLAGEARLAEQVRTSPGWERAVETVLGARLQALCVADAAEHVRALQSLPEGDLTLFRPGPSPETAAEHAPGAVPLGRYVQPGDCLGTLLHGVYAVLHLDDALALQSKLLPTESVVTRSGVWLGPDWAHFARDAVDTGVLERRRQLEEVGRERTALVEQVEFLEREHHAVAGRLGTLEDEQGRAQELLSEAHERVATLQAEQGAREARLDQTSRRLVEVGAEQRELATSIEEQRSVDEGARDAVRATSREAERLARERDSWEEGREPHRVRLEQARERWNATRDASYKVGLRIESMRARREALQGAMEQSRKRIENAEARCRVLERELHESEGPAEDAQTRLQAGLQRKSGFETQLRSARGAVEEAEGRLVANEQRRQESLSQTEAEREALERQRMAGQEVAVRRKTLEEQLAALGLQVRDLLDALNPHASEEAWEERLGELGRRISRLGPINLAAIEEHDELAEQKAYLDAQHEDLSDALATLDAAIRKIDREMRARFRSTYDKVNAGLARMFPRLFGGGEANLILTGEDLLDTGVAVMARPPGKRNTHIALLSGGEKALCAIALVFAIFELNPAPFCLLDEVDAPLDDSNVVRFCELVKEMAERLQLVMVTHNKISMEIAHQLIGVTMNEPGVSRLVTVDLDEAVEMAAQ